MSPLPRLLFSSTRTKILFFFAALMATLGVLLLLAVRGTVVPSLHQLYQSTGRVMAVNLADRVQRPLEAGDHSVLSEILLDAVAADENVVYALIVDSEGRILAHTFTGGIPAGVASLPPPAEPVALAELDADSGPVDDFAARVPGGDLGYVRIAITEEGIERAVAKVRRAIFVAAMAVFSLGMVLLLLGAKAVLHPIRLLTRLVMQIRDGEYGVQVEEAGQDEIGRLVSSVNAMSESLRIQRESLEEAQSRLEKKNVELRSATRQLREEKEKLRAVIEGMSEGVVYADPEGRVVFYNRSAEVILGSGAEGLGGTLTEIARGRHASELEEALRTFVEDPSAEGPRRILGVVDTAESFLSPVRDPSGGFLGVVLVSQDLTERLRLEAEHKALQAQLSLQDKMAALGSLSASVAHELNTPLGTVLLQAQLLGKKVFEPSKVEALSTIEAEVKRCRRIVANLLDFSRRSEGRRTPVEPAEIVERAAGLVANEFRLRSLVLEWSADPDLPPILADRDQLLQVLLNLLENAADASSSEGRIEIRAELDGEESIVLRVSDHGKGIPEEELPRIFEQFYTTKGSGRGTGLGLPICDQIVRQHGGRIDVESRVGDGTTFVVRLPKGEA